VRKKGQPTHQISEGRATCYTCLRPHAHCVCGFITPFAAHTNLLLLQHPNEWRKYYSTAKLVRQAITNASLMRGVTFSEKSLQSTMNPYETYMLYPGAQAADCEEVELSDRHLVIVIDGTWDEAQKIVYRNPILHNIRRISFNRAFTSTYRIRKPPKVGYLSTVESVAHLLTLNAVRSGKAHMIPTYQGLFTLFDEMISRQLAHMGEAARVRE
jgi:DTW domain-containing protein YfiP